MVSITCYGGVDEIGGNKILIEDKKTRIFLDFGQSFTLLDEYFVPESFLSPRARCGLKDYFEFGLMPKLPGLYSRKGLESTDLEFSVAAFDGVFISHSHFDHVAHLPYLHQDIPVYMGETTKKILESTAASTATSDYQPEGSVETFRSGKEITVGDLKVTPVHVDHSVPGAYGFLVETSEGVIAYSGDLRKHGPRADMTVEFTEKAKAACPSALIIEGTRVAPKETRKNHTEAFVRSESEKVAKECKGLTLAMRYPKDLDRFRTFYEVAKTTGKELLISMKTAHLLRSLADDCHLPLPRIGDPSIKIYERMLLRPPTWQKEFSDMAVDSAYVSKNQDHIILELDFYTLNELIDIQPKGGACIHSMSEPFEEDPISQVSDRVLNKWCSHFGLTRHQLHASGHAAKEEIFGMIDEIKAKSLVPVHTQSTGLFPKHLDVKKGKTMKI